jgi:hypothetical protein
MGKLGTAWSTFWAIMGGAEFVPKSDLDGALSEARKGGDDAINEAQKKVEESEKALAEAEQALEEAKKAPDRFAEGAVYSLLLLQREGRLIDFLQEDISGFGDEDIGRAVRQIHSGCRGVLADNFGAAPVMDKAEGEAIKLDDAVDPSRIKLTGNVPDAPPYSGTLQHKGWHAAKLHFPERTGSYDETVIYPAEVEI